jgi:hypothetical protein
MTPHQKLIKLATKFAQAESANDQIEEFAFDFHRELMSIISEMDGEILTLKERLKDQVLIEEFKKLFRILKKEAWDFDFQNPYGSGKRFVNIFTSKTMLSLIQNLEFIIHQKMKNHQIHSLKHLMEFIKTSAAHIEQFGMAPTIMKDVSQPIVHAPGQEALTRVLR